MSTTLHLSTPMPRWRKKIGLHVRHMMARKAKVFRLAFHHGARRDAN